MYIGTSAEKFPDKPALIFADSGRTMTFGELDERSNRLAQALYAFGLRPGDGVAAVSANEEHFFELFWAAMRSGLFFTPVNWHLSAEEMEYVVDDCDAQVLLASARFADVVSGFAGRLSKVKHRLAIGGPIAGFQDYRETIAKFPAERLADEREGGTMIYSSGTTGRPKGVRPTIQFQPAGTGSVIPGTLGFSMLFGFDENDRYLCPGPLYHAAPLQFSQIQHRLGATVVLMERFDPEKALAAIDRHKVTTSQWVPTHFNRLLRLPEDVKKKYDVSSLKIAVHAAAPCPIDVKRAMIEWWGPKIVEYYAGTEGGGTLIGSADWLAHPGSVGRHWAGGTVHVLDENGADITEPNVDGAIYFEAPEDVNARFRYHKDDAKTAATYRGNLFTLGDVGHLDAEGFLYLTDRKSHMIISGGVNIYPQEVENCLATHPQIEDVAVLGVPHEDMGEEVKAVVQLRPGVQPSKDLEREIIEYTRAHIAHYKAPRSVDFVAELPRMENGKIYKRLLRDRYWASKGAARI